MQDTWCARDPTTTRRMAAVERKKKRNDLCLKMKHEVILASEREPGIPSRKLAKIFNCGKSQIQDILKNKQHYKDLYEQSTSDKMKHCRKHSSILTSMKPCINGFSQPHRETFSQMPRFSWRRLYRLMQA